jgi:integrase/recombinase XerC
VSIDAESRLTLPPDTPARWCDAVTAWTTYARAAGRSGKTIRLQRHYLARLARGCPDPWRVTTDDLLAFLARPGWAPETRRSARAAFRAFYGWGLAAGRIRRDPAVLLPTVHIPPTVPKTAPQNVVDGALEAADERTTRMVLLARLEGLRRAEIATLAADDVHADHLRIRGKGGRTRVVPLHPTVAVALAPAVLAARERGDGWIFPRVQARGLAPPRPTGEHVTPGHVGKLVAAVLGPGWSTHALRHAAATSWYAVDRDLLAVQQLLGHSKPETTQRYVALPDDALRAAVLGR